MLVEFERAGHENSTRPIALTSEYRGRSMGYLETCNAINQVFTIQYDEQDM